MIQDKIHQNIINNCDAVSDWFTKRSAQLRFSFYSSFDIRDSGEKVAPVDANIFPAGFNNICPQDKEAAANVIKNYLSKSYPSAKGPIALLAEEHTANSYYWENVRTIKLLIESAGHAVKVTVPRVLSKAVEVRASSGEVVLVEPNSKENGNLIVAGEPIDFIICNNDFSDEKEDWAEGLKTPMNPPRELGWYQRKKSEFFSHYNQLAREFSDVIKLKNGCLEVITEKFDNFSADEEQSLEDLAARVDLFIENLKVTYDKMQFTQKPYVYIKNNSGTYGMGVVQVQSGDEVRGWNSKTKKKMRAAKGGRDVSSVILQEGIVTRFSSGAETAEPCIYLVGCELVGGFLRTHSEKSAADNLNSPGAVFKRLCMADLLHEQSDCPMENVYGWISKLGSMAIALEAQKMKAPLPARAACGK